MKRAPGGDKRQANEGEGTSRLVMPAQISPAGGQYQHAFYEQWRSYVPPAQLGSATAEQGAPHK